MINVFVALRETYIRTAPGVDAWNQEPVDAAALTGGTRHINGCPISRAVTDNSDYQTMLTNFGTWRGGRLATRRYASWHLMTNCFPPPGTVGLAYIGVTCNTGKYGVGWSSFQSEATWLTVAHEIGHNFGAYHTLDTGGIMSYDSIITKEYKFTGANPSQVGHVMSDSGYNGPYLFQIKIDCIKVSVFSSYADLQSRECGQGRVL